MNKNIYRQYDSRWGNLPYPNKSNISGSGCGLCAVLHCIIEMEKYKDYTPKTIHKYMKQFAVDGQGTLWSGIPRALKHYGMKEVKELDTMPELWTELKKGNRVAVLLMSSGACKDGTVWTTSGHYIGAITDYKVKDKKHYVYIKDSSPRKNDGWKCYEDSMINHVSKVWVAAVPKEQRASTVTKAKTEVPVKVEKTANEKCIDAVIAYADKLVADNSLTYKKWTSSEATHKCPIHQKNKGNVYMRKGSKVIYVKKEEVEAYKEKGWKIATDGMNCIGFAGACFKHGGGVDVSCSESGLLNNDFANYDNLTLAKWRKRNGKEWDLVAKQDKKIPTSKLRKGDVVLTYSGKTYKHTFIYIGNGEIVDATSTHGIARRKYSDLGSTPKIAFRYTGKGKF